MRTLVWFRGKDLRVTDHVPLLEAARGECIPLFVLDPYFFSAPSAAELPHRMQFLLESLAALEKNLAALGSELVLVAGKSVDVVPQLARELAVDRVVAHRWTEPFGKLRDARIEAALHVPFERFEGETLAPTTALRTGEGKPFSVFTPFARAFAKTIRVDRPRPAPKRLPPLPDAPEVARVIARRRTHLPTLESLGLSHNPNLVAGGERAARKRLTTFLEGPLGNYESGRDRMDLPHTSRLSQDLKFGVLSPRTVYHAVNDALGGDPESRCRYVAELLWREFAYATLEARPELLKEPFRKDFAAFPWARGGAGWEAWREGRTGYPVVDAAARQLLQEGFVHNRARMISASFLTKHLLVHYQDGESHYLKFLTDGDWAINNMGWQWSAGCGCDAQPYFRVFNPITQGERFDPEGDYVRRYVPELRKLPAKLIHQPWAAEPLLLRQAGVTLGDTYPRPIVDHAAARARFLTLAKKHLGARDGGRSGDA